MLLELGKKKGHQDRFVTIETTFRGWSLKKNLEIYHSLRTTLVDMCRTHSFCTVYIYFFQIKLKHKRNVFGVRKSLNK